MLTAIACDIQSVEESVVKKCSKFQQAGIHINSSNNFSPAVNPPILSLDAIVSFMPGKDSLVRAHRILKRKMSQKNYLLWLQLFTHFKIYVTCEIVRTRNCDIPCSVSPVSR